MLDLDQMVPSAIAGIETISCQCGWSASFILPEEATRRDGALWNHVITAHGIQLPAITIQHH